MVTSTGSNANRCIVRIPETRVRAQYRVRVLVVVVYSSEYLGVLEYSTDRVHNNIDDKQRSRTVAEVVDYW